MQFALDPEIIDFAGSIDSLLAKSDMPAVIRSWAAGDTAPGTAVWGRVAETGARPARCGATPAATAPTSPRSVEADVASSAQLGPP